MRRRLIVHVLIAALALASTPRLVHAQDPARCIDRLNDLEIAHRLRWIETRFERGKRHARAWYYSWLSFSVVAAAFSWTRFALADRDDGLTRDSQFISGLGALALTGTMSGMSMTAAFAPQRLARLPRDTPEERRSALVEATRLLRLAARRQRPATRLVSHIAPALVAGVAGSYLLGRYHDEPVKDLVVPVGIAYAFPLIVAEARVWTQPTQAIRDYEQYRTFACSGAYVPTPEEERDPLADDGAPLEDEAPIEDGAPVDEETPASDEPRPDASFGTEPNVRFGVAPTQLMLHVSF